MALFDKWIKTEGSMAVLTLFSSDFDEEREVRVPFKFEICPYCEGCGTDRGASVECDGGGFTASEWAEQDDEFKEDYLAGRYDQPCSECRRYPGRILVPDTDYLGAEDRAAWESQCDDEIDYQRQSAAERRMGA